jgi:hypothetical protein
MNLTKENISSILEFTNISLNLFENSKDLRFVKEFFVNGDKSFTITLRYECVVDKYTMECSKLKNDCTIVKTIQDALNYIAKCAYLVGSNDKIDSLNKVLVKH